MDIGEPQHIVKCTLCRRQVGGPYFSAFEAHERKREHFKNVHDVYTAYTSYRHEARRMSTFTTRTVFE